MDKIIFSNRAIISIQNEINIYNKVETGGALLGYFDKKNNAYYVNTVIDGGPKAIREIYNFKCDLDYTNMMIDKLVNDSNGSLRYLGEWHSHPQYTPEPSDVDLESLYNMTIGYGKEVIMTIFGFIDFDIENIEKQSIAVIYNKSENAFYSIPLIFEKEEF